MLAASGYTGERVGLMHPTDQIYYHAMSSVVAGALRDIGINLDEQTVDWGTVVERRTSKEPIEKGGWSLFPAGYPAAEYRDPIFATNIAETARTHGRWPSTQNWSRCERPGWTVMIRPNATGSTPRSNPGPSKPVPFIPLGQYLPPAAWRSNLRGLLKGAVSCSGTWRRRNA